MRIAGLLLARYTAIFVGHCNLVLKMNLSSDQEPWQQRTRCENKICEGYCKDLYSRHESVRFRASPYGDINFLTC